MGYFVLREPVVQKRASLSRAQLKIQSKFFKCLFVNLNFFS